MAWTLEHSSTFTGPVSSVAAGAALVDGWYDNSGSVWSVTSEGYLSALQTSAPKNNGLLLRSADAKSVDQRLTLQAKVTGSVSCFAVLRSDGVSTGATEYEFSINASPMIAVVVGGATTVLKTLSLSRSIVSGETLTLDASCVQTDSATTTLSLTLTDSTGAVLCSDSLTDTTSALQNVSGYSGVFMNEGVTSGTAQVALIHEIDIYSYSTATLTTVAVNDSSFLFSPGNWVGDTGRSGSAWRRAWNCGAWFEFTFTASTDPVLNLLAGASTCGAKLTVYVNGVEVLTRTSANGSVSVTGLNASKENLIRVVVASAGNDNRYNGADNSVKVTGAAVDTASKAGTARSLGSWGMIVGSSRTEGLYALSDGTQDWTKDYSALVADALISQGIDICVSACSGSDYLIAGDGGQVPAYYPNVSGQTARWNLVDAGVSLLDSAGHISAYGNVGEEPDFVCIDLFSNGATAGEDTTAMSSAMINCMAALRGAAPNAWIFIIVPSGFYYAATYPENYLAALKAAFTTYETTYPSDGRVALIDLGSDLSMRITSAVGLYVNSDHIHPLDAGHALIAPVIMSGVQQALSGPTYQI